MFGKKKPEPAEEEIIVKVEPVIEAEPVAAEKKEVKPAGTFIAEGVTFIGNFETGDDFEIKGTVRGTVVSTKPMHIDSTGALYGDAKVESLYVDGEVEGTVVVEDLSVLSETGKLKGNLSTAKLQSAPGSAFEGSLKMELPKKAQPAPVYEAPAEDLYAPEPAVREVSRVQDFDAIFDAPVDPQAEKDLSNLTFE